MDKLLILIQTLGKNFDKKITIRELSKKSEIPYTTTRRLINSNKELFTIKQKANIKLISLNLNNEITKNYLIISERKNTQIFLKLNPKIKILIKEIPKGKYTLILFGSRAENKQRKKSDIDICVINKNAEKKISFSNFELLFKLEVNPIYLKNNEFEKMLKEKQQNIAKEVIKKHIILYGEEYFWNLIWKNKEKMQYEI